MPIELLKLLQISSSSSSPYQQADTHSSQSVECFKLDLPVINLQLVARDTRWLALSDAKLVIGTQTHLYIQNHECNDDRDWKKTSVKVCTSRKKSLLSLSAGIAFTANWANLLQLTTSAARIICTVTLNLTLINLDRFSFGRKTCCSCCWLAQFCVYESLVLLKFSEIDCRFFLPVWSVITATHPSINITIHSDKKWTVIIIVGQQWLSWLMALPSAAYAQLVIH